MRRYVALLRGINVGGKNKITMPELKAVYEAQGYRDVVTYINSGNVIFSSNDTAESLKTACESAIAGRFGLEIAVAVVSAEDLAAALQNAPDWWNKDTESKHNVLFVIAPATSEDVIAQVGIAKPEFEQVGYYGQVIFWSAPIKTFSRTRWSKIVSKSAYNSVTIRNANTTCKLSALMTQL